MLNEILALSSLSGVYSWEDAVRDYIVKEATAAGGQVRVDALGNVIVEKKGACPAFRKILLTAHMDEVGMMVTDFEEDGCLRFDLVGQVDRRCLIGKPVLVGEKGLPGVVGIKAIHLVTREEAKKTPATDTLYIDFGARNKEEAQKLCRLGEVCAFTRKATPFGDGLVKGPALTSRIPCAILLNLLRQELPVDCTFAFTVQQEVGSRGAFGVGFSVKPDAAIVVDGIAARDFPGMEGDSPKLGSGPVLSLMDKSAVYDRGLFNTLSGLAREKSIPWQCVGGGSGTEGGVLQRSRAGVPVLAVKVPVRYPNTPACVASLADSEHTYELLCTSLKKEKGAEQ